MPFEANFHQNYTTLMFLVLFFQFKNRTDKNQVNHMHWKGKLDLISVVCVSLFTCKVLVACLPADLDPVQRSYQSSDNASCSIISQLPSFLKRELNKILCDSDLTVTFCFV